MRRVLYRCAQPLPSSSSYLKLNLEGKDSNQPLGSNLCRTRVNRFSLPPILKRNKRSKKFTRFQICRDVFKANGDDSFNDSERTRWWPRRGWRWKRRWGWCTCWDRIMTSNFLHPSRPGAKRHQPLLPKNSDGTQKKKKVFAYVFNYRFKLGH